MVLPYHRQLVKSSRFAVFIGVSVESTSATGWSEFQRV
jgi:hypothetical protein